MVTENIVYTEYNLNLISLNYIINFIAEPRLQDFCLKYNFNLKINSRDTQRLIIHFIAESLIDQCSRFNDTRNLLCINNIHAKLLDSPYDEILNKCVHKVLKKFRICSYSANYSIESFTRDDIYSCKSIADKCALKVRSLARVKEYLHTNEMNHLFKRIKHDIKTQQTLINRLA